MSDSQLPIPDPFVAVESADPLELARLVDRLGDQSVVERLERNQPVEVQLAALRAAPWMKSPEIVLKRAMAIMLSRDSELAPVASRTVAKIASLLDRDRLQTREVAVGELTTVVDELASAGENPLLRADIRLYASQAAQALMGAGVPSRR